jgi:hypothetical protein
VWHWIVTSHIEFHDAYSAIAKRLKAYYTLQISPNTVKAIIETFLVANSQEAAQETTRAIRESGRIYLALDGQRPNNGESGLWLFIDTITNRIIHMEYLKSASWDVLAEVFQLIKKKYDVPIEAVVSDHQHSILKAVKEALPGVPHQLCHYHFLKNLHRTVNALDSHLHVQLAAAVNQLYIRHLGDDRTVLFHGQKTSLRDWFAPIVRDLSRLLRRRTRDFDVFAGFSLYEQLTEYVKLLDTLLKEVQSITSIANLVAKTIINLKKALKHQSPLHTKLELLIPLFHDARRLLGAKSSPKLPSKRPLDRWRARLQELHKSLTGHLIAQKPRYQRMTAHSAIEDIITEWARLYSTHRMGLFYFLNLPGLPRSNVALEKMFSLELHHFRTASGKSQVGNLARVKGGELCLVLQNYNPDLIIQVLLDRDREQIEAGIQQFRQRHDLQSSSWLTNRPKAPLINQMIELAQKSRVQV